jgi:hypothetical protein
VTNSTVQPRAFRGMGPLSLTAEQFARSSARRLSNQRTGLARPEGTRLRSHVCADPPRRLAPRAQVEVAWGEGLGSGARYRARSRGSWSATAWLRRKWRLTAARIRTSSGVTQLDLGPGSRMAHRMPWLGLLLWALACAGLFVSLLV